MVFNFKNMFRRKVIYNFFLFIFICVVIMFVYWFSLYQGMSVENAEVYLFNNTIEVHMSIANISNHPISGVMVKAISSEKTFSQEIGTIKSGEVFDFYLKSLPIPSDLYYDVEISAPYNRRIIQKFELQKDVFDPVNVRIEVPIKMLIGEEYTLKTELCNVSGKHLPVVEWNQVIDSKFFKEELLPHNFSISPEECKPLYSTLTPIFPGNTSLNFTLRVGNLVKNTSHEVEVLLG